MRTNSALVALAFLPAFAFATTPTITSVNGTVQTGQTLTISGTTMVDENKTNWLPMFRSGTAYGFEGSGYVADGYDEAPDEMTYGTWSYDSTVKLTGNQSVKGRVTAASKTGAGFYIPVSGTDLYVRMYTKWHSAGTWLWPDSFIKMLTTMGPTDQLYFQPNATSGSTLPTQVNMQYNSAPHLYSVNNFLTDNRWYCIEARFKTSSPTNYTTWVDNTQIASINDHSSVGTQEFIQFGMINMCCQGSGFDLSEWVDDFTVSTSRVTCSSIIEIGNNSNYSIATKVYQEPLFLSDGSIQIKADLTGLGTGPYYLWVTNNRQERSATYNLSGGGDTTPPTTTISTSDPSAISNDGLTVVGTASDDTAVSGCKWRISSAPDGSNGTACSGTTSFSCSTSGYAIGANTLYVGCYDAVGNYGSDSITVNYTDASPPVVSGGAPSGEQPYGTTFVNMTVTTNEAATCKFGSTDTNYASLPSTFLTTGGTSHSQPIAVSNGSSYTRYIRCIDGTGNANTASTVVSWTVAASAPGQTVFFSEGYEDNSFASRGWYDITTGTVDTAEHHSGNASLRCTYNSGGTDCTAPKRHKFTESDSVYLSYWVKFSSNFVGSGVGYHPHEFLFLTNLNGDYDGLAFDYLTLYLESHWDSSSNGYMQTGFQDGQNIDQSQIGQDLIGVTENRAVAGCNGSPSGYSGGCYDRGDGVYVNGVLLSTPQTFTTVNKNTWNHVEAYYQLNSISNGIGQANGIIRVWFNDSLVFERTNAILRTGQRPTMKLNQFIFGPWIGDGSPVTQTMWIDDLVVASARSGSSIPQVLSAPTNFRIIN